MEPGKFTVTLDAAVTVCSLKSLSEAAHDRLSMAVPLKLAQKHLRTQKVTPKQKQTPCTFSGVGCFVKCFVKSVQNFVPLNACRRKSDTCRPTRRLFFFVNYGLIIML